MSLRASRRAFLGAVPLALAAPGLTGDKLPLGDQTPRPTARSGRDLESLLGLIIDTPPGRRAAAVAGELRKGLSHREFLTARYLAAAFEDAALASERWRPAFLAATVNVLRGPASEDAPVFKQAREALAKL